MTFIKGLLLLLLDLLDLLLLLKYGHFGFNDDGISGMAVCSFRPINSSAGLYPFRNGVDQYASSVVYGSSLFFNISLMVFTALSTSPLACEYFGLLVMCENLHAVAKAWNVSAEYCGPLSVTTYSGIPCLANIATQFDDIHKC